MNNDLKWDSYWGSVNVSVLDAYEEEMKRVFPTSYRNVVSEFNGAYVINKDAYRFYDALMRSEQVYSVGLMHAFGATDSLVETMA